MENKAQVNRLGTSKIGKLMLEFAIPSIIGLVVNGLYNIIDSIFLGHGVGQQGLAAATIAMPLMVVSMSVSALIGIGGNALAALRLGEGKYNEAEKVIGTSVTLMVILAVAVTVLVNVFMDPVLALSGAREDTWESAHVFVRIISFGFILQFFGMGFNHFIRTAGDPNRALYTMIAGTVVCIILNYLFVMVFKWGIAGSAWATVIGQGVTAALVLWYFTFSKKAPFKIRLVNLRPTWRLSRTICALGTASFVLQIAAAILNVVMNNQLAHFGAMSPLGAEGALAGIGVVQRVALFAFFPVIGVAFASLPIFGYNYGAQNFERVKTTFKIALLWMTLIGLFFWVIIHLFPSQIVYLFGVKDSLEEFTIRALQIQVFFMPLIGLQALAGNYFQSSGQPLRAMFVTLTRQLLYLIPLLYILPAMASNGYFFAGVGPLDAIYYSYPIADVLSVLTAGVMMAFEWRKLSAKIKRNALKESTD